MQYVDGDAGDFDDFGLCQFAAPRRFVDIAADGGQGRDGCKFLENLWIADVASVDDVLRPVQDFERFGTKPAVSVGDDADEDGSSQFSDFGF